MMCREIDPRIGDQVILCQPESSYFLPAELQAHTTATLIGNAYGTALIEQNGRTWQISDRCIQHDFEFKVGNRWYPADHPLVAQEREKEKALVAALAAQPEIGQLLR